MRLSLLSMKRIAYFGDGVGAWVGDSLGDSVGDSVRPWSCGIVNMI